MKIVILGIIATISLIAHGTELTTATNDQLLGEVARRLQGGEGGGTAVASYTCDNSGYLYIHLMNGAGQTKEAYYRTPGYNQCLVQISPLTANKSKIHEATVAAICDSSNYLYRVPLTPNGVIGTVSYLSTASYDACITQAKMING